MMLTDEEKQACRTARFLKGRGHQWGTPELGLCPIGAVAALRGAVPKLYPGYPEYSFFDRKVEEGKQGFFHGHDAAIADEATKDVLEWTNLPDLGAFLDALDAHGTAIFPSEEVSA